MNTMRRLIVLTLWLAAAVATMSPVHSANASPASAAALLAQSDGPTLGQAVEQVRRQYNGRIVSAETQLRGNREVHVIRVMTQDGKVKTVRINGRTRQSRG